MSLKGVTPEVAMPATYLLGYMRGLMAMGPAGDLRVVPTFLRELERIVEQDKAYHTVKEG